MAPARLRRFLIVPALCALPLAAAAAGAAMPEEGLSYREKLLLVALALAALAMIGALGSMILTRARYKARLNRHIVELRKAFANAYVGMRDTAVDVERVRDAERVLERIIRDLEHFI
jgi:hypothetical protein